LVRISGTGAEKLFDRFAHDLGICSSIDSSPSKQLEFVQSLDSLLQKRLQDGTTYGYQPFPSQDEWLADIRINKLPPALRDSGLASQWTAFLADRVIATDSIIRINNLNGESVKIGLDITINPDPEEIEKKLAKIRGLKTNLNSQFNDNKNIPKVRQALGIDKHLVLVLPDHTERFPKFEVILDRLHAAANSPAQTKLINLAELPLEQTLDWQQHFEQVQPQNLWKFYNNKFVVKEGRLANSSSIKDVQKVGALAVEDGLRKDKIVAALQQSNWYKEQASKPQQKDRDFADRTLGQMIHKLIDANAAKLEVNGENHQPTHGELLRWYGAATSAEDLTAKDMAVGLLRQLKAEFNGTGDETPPRTFSSPNVLVTPEVRERMELIVKEQTVTVTPRFDIKVRDETVERKDLGRGR
jgi:hypothetical protein